jgi:hypothetical protein
MTRPRFELPADAAAAVPTGAVAAGTCVLSSGSSPTLPPGDPDGKPLRQCEPSPSVTGIPEPE